MDKDKEEVQSQALWLSLFGRVLFGYESKIKTYSSFFSQWDYIHSLINQEEEVQVLYRKILSAFMFLNVMAILYYQGVQVEFVFAGVALKSIPALSHILCFLMGVNLFGLVLVSLDAMLLAAMRTCWVKTFIFTDLPNIATAHLKGGGVYVDLFLPREIGFQSGPSERWIRYIFYSSLFIFIILMFLAGLVGLISMFIYCWGIGGVSAHWPMVMSIAGVMLGSVSVVLMLVAIIVPFKFECSELQANETNELTKTD